MGGRGTLQLALVLAAVVSGPAAAAPSLTARAAIVMDAASGEVLWERNADQPLPPASTTKVLTAILALESGRLDDAFRVSDFAAETAPSKINLRAGQRMRLRDLLYAVLLNSANDAAVVVAEGLAGSESAFAARMNQRARELGARNAHFENPHGLTADGHVASARDLAVIFRHGLDLPAFREILATRSTQVPLVGDGIRGGVRRIGLHSHNRLLSGYTYPVIGKTGFTRPARRCFVGAATHDGREIIIALLGASDLWGDAKRLFGYGFGATSERAPVVMAGMLPVPSLRQHGAARTPPAPAEHAEGDDEAAADQGPGYVVQLGPYANHRLAAATRTKLAARGYTAALSGLALRIGSFASREPALKLARRLRLSGYRPVVVALR